MRGPIFLAAAFFALCAAEQAQAASIWDGVYSDAQAARGRTKYNQNCGFCHGQRLEGSFDIAPLMGRFMPYWSGTTMDVLMDYINTAMPLGRTGAVSRADDADIIAYILQMNGLPAGSAELGADATALGAITFDPQRPAPPASASRRRGR